MHWQTSAYIIRQRLSVPYQRRGGQCGAWGVLSDLQAIGEEPRVEAPPQQAPNAVLVQHSLRASNHNNTAQVSILDTVRGQAISLYCSAGPTRC